MTLTLVGLSITHLYGVMEYVLVNVNGLVFPTDFVIVDIKEDNDASLILGRHFLATRKAVINVESGELTLKFNNEEVIFDTKNWKQHADDHELTTKLG